MLDVITYFVMNSKIVWGTSVFASVLYLKNDNVNAALIAICIGVIIELAKKLQEIG